MIKMKCNYGRTGFASSFLTKTLAFTDKTVSEAPDLHFYVITF